MNEENINEFDFNVFGLLPANFIVPHGISNASFYFEIVVTS